VLEHLGIKDSFGFVLASLPLGYEKPDPRIFGEALRLSGVCADEALHVGDDKCDDYIGAKNSGWRALLLDRSQPTDWTQERIKTLTELEEALR
jgi:putative hydrolase of the HAD superfamily